MRALVIAPEIAGNPRVRPPGAPDGRRDIDPKRLKPSRGTVTEQEIHRFMVVVKASPATPKITLRVEDPTTGGCELEVYGFPRLAWQAFESWLAGVRADQKRLPPERGGR